MTTLTPDDISRLSRFVSDSIGFSYSIDRLRDLERGFLASCRDMGEKDPAACLSLLDDPLSASRLQEELIKKLTIGETYFFRDKNLFSHLRDILLPDLIRNRRRTGKTLRIWCTACSTGEEPYSVAILLRYLLPDISEWDIFILGTDINPGSLHAAERGIYSKWSFREEPPVPIRSFFTPGTDGRQHIIPEIRHMVRFSQFNLVTDIYPSCMNNTKNMDLVLCRNVLMYFSAEIAATVVDRLHASLVHGGWLLVSPQEISYAQRPGFTQVKKSTVFLFQKGVESGNQKNHDTLTPGSRERPSDLHPDTILVNHINDPGYTEPDDTLSMERDVFLLRETDNSPSSLRDGTAGYPRFPVSSPLLTSDDPEALILGGRIAEAENILLHNDRNDSRSLGQMEIIARIFADQGDFDRALGWCDRVLSIEPLRPVPYHLRAVIQQDQGNPVSAVQSLRQALYADPDYIPAHLMMGTIMGSQGRPADSVRHYQVVLRILSGLSDETPVDDIDGMPAGRVREMISVLLNGVK